MTKNQIKLDKSKDLAKSNKLYLFDFNNGIFELAASEFRIIRFQLDPDCLDPGFGFGTEGDRLDYLI